MPWPDSLLLRGCINLHTQVTAKFGCEKDFCVSHDGMGVWKSVLSSGVWGFMLNWLICHGEPNDWDPLDVFVRARGGWPRSSSSLSLLASGSGNVDTQSGEQPQKP